MWCQVDIIDITIYQPIVDDAGRSQETNVFCFFCMQIIHDINAKSLCLLPNSCTYIWDFLYFHTGTLSVCHFWKHFFALSLLFICVSCPYFLMLAVSCWTSERRWDCAKSWHCSLVGLWWRKASRAWVKCKRCSVSDMATWRSSLILCWLVNSGRI